MLRNLFILAFIPLSACSQSNVERDTFNIMLKKLLSHTVDQTYVSDHVNNATSVVYLDAREKNEYEVSHIKDAIWVGYNDFKLERITTLDKSTPVLVYCSVGYRSEKVAEKLIAEGFSNVSNLYGGIFEWKNQENDVVNIQGIKTDSIHAYSPSWGIWLNEGIKVY